jgi:hypothetical protein
LNLQAYLQPRIESRLARIIELPLARAYQQQDHRSQQEVAEPACESILSTGRQLRDQSLQFFQQKYKGLNYRLLFQIPDQGIGVIWFQDLMQCLTHCGLAVESVSMRDPEFHQKWEAFRPNVFISMDTLEVLRSLDLDYIQAYKKKNGLIRLFTPINPYRFPKPGLSSEDHWRLDLAQAGKSVDAYFSMMQETFFERFCSDWHQAGFLYLCLPFGCNPFIHYPRNAEKTYDYFMATSFGYERAKLTYQFILPIFRKHAGLWAGPQWKFGMGPLPAVDVPSYYAQSKIVLNPLAGFIKKYPAEITERAFSATACGAFQITEPTPITEEFFRSDELIQAENADDFQRLFEYYLLHADERNEIVLKGMQHVYAQHTYFHRIEKLLTFLQQL